MKSKHSVVRGIQIILYGHDELVKISLRDSVPFITCEAVGTDEPEDVVCDSRRLENSIIARSKHSFCAA